MYGIDLGIGIDTDFFFGTTMPPKFNGSLFFLGVMVVVASVALAVGGLTDTDGTSSTTTTAKYKMRSEYDE